MPSQGYMVPGNTYEEYLPVARARLIDTRRKSRAEGWAFQDAVTDEDLIAGWDFRDAFKNELDYRWCTVEDRMHTWGRFSHAQHHKARKLWHDADCSFKDAIELARDHAAAMEAEKGPYHQTTKHWQSVTYLLGHIFNGFKRFEIQYPCVGE